MDRPIAYDKLAREDRFVRMRARDVAQLKVDQGLPPFADLSTRDSMRERVHGIFVGELQAMEGAGRSVYDFPDAPWEFTLDMARQVWDEPRHVETYLGLLDHLGGYVGEFPETTLLWRCACAEDAAARVAGVNRGLEGLACDVFNQLIRIAEERRHAAAGALVLERLLAHDRALAERARHWERRVLDALAAAGGITGDVEPPLLAAPATAPDPTLVAQDLVASPRQ